MKAQDPSRGLGSGCSPVVSRETLLECATSLDASARAEAPLSSPAMTAPSGIQSDLSLESGENSSSTTRGEQSQSPNIELSAVDFACCELIHVVIQTDNRACLYFSAGNCREGTLGSLPPQLGQVVAPGVGRLQMQIPVRLRSLPLGDVVSRSVRTLFGGLE